jgi:putative transposase
MRHREHQLSFVIKRHGGARAGAGRKPSARSNVPHRPRAKHDHRHPVHVTLRAAALPASLRARDVAAGVHRALRISSRTDFRIVEYSIQPDHLHLIVEGGAGTR